MKNLQILLIALFCLTNNFSVLSQKINAPAPDFNHACITDSFNSFTVQLSFTEKVYNSDNIFYLELSDKNGNFDAPTVVSTIRDKNVAFSFSTSFAFPKNLYGDNFKLRVKTTSPASISNATAPFNAYYIPQKEIVLNNYQDITACDSKVSLHVNENIAEKYVWYKNGQIYSIEDGSVDITSPGEYYVEPFFGECTGSIYSNIVVVNFSEGLDISIGNQEEIAMCAGETHTFTSNYVDEYSTYNWYKNGELIENLNAYMPSLTVNANEGNYGMYVLEVTNSGGCTISSKPVQFSKLGNTITVEAGSSTSRFLFEGEKAVLTVKTNAVNPQITWYKNLDKIANTNNSASLEVAEEGSYHAEIIGETSCLKSAVKSPEFIISRAVALEAKIDISENYIPCESNDAQIKIESLLALNKEGNKMVIAEEDYYKFNLDWFKDGDLIQSSKGVYPADSYSNNGDYLLKVSKGNIETTSNNLLLSLGLPKISLTAEYGVVCANGEASLTAAVVKDAIYSWYNNDQLLTETLENTIVINGPGSYRVEANLLGCSKSSEQVIISEFDESAISISPSNKIELRPNGREYVYATGADRYLWKDALGNVLSSSDSFEANTEGKYYLEAYQGNCYITKEIDITIEELVVIPNVVSPNNDSINDQWVLPSRFSNDPEVEVIICDSYGKSVFKAKGYQNNWPNESNLNASIYYYFINKNGKAIKKGSITLVN